MPSNGWAELYGWHLDRASLTPVFRQVYLQVRSGVLSGALAPGSRLPSTRVLAPRLGIARASVVAAYEQLLAEGYADGRAGSGTFVSADLGGLVVHGSPRQPRPRPARRQPIPASAQAFAEFARSTTQPDERPFNTGRTLVDARTIDT